MRLRTWCGSYVETADHSWWIWILVALGWLRRGWTRKARHLRSVARAEETLVVATENVRRRQRREVEEANFAARRAVLLEMLPVADSLERAIEWATRRPRCSESAIIEQVFTAQLEALQLEGVQLVLRQLLSAFERLDVTPCEAAGQSFDPRFHEAVSMAESDQPPGTVVQVLQRGYRLGDRLLRPALVVVAKAPGDRS